MFQLALRHNGHYFGGNTGEYLSGHICLGESVLVVMCFEYGCLVSAPCFNDFGANSCSIYFYDVTCVPWPLEDVKINIYRFTGKVLCMLLVHTLSLHSVCVCVCVCVRERERECV